MTDLEIAIANLKGHSICLCKKGEYFTDDGRGISPMMRFIAEGKELTGFCVADQIVGKAAAMLFVKAGVRGVYGKPCHTVAKPFLKQTIFPTPMIFSQTVLSTGKERIFVLWRKLLPI